MNIYILSTSSFPWGMAATSRIRCLCKAIIQEGGEIEHIGLCGADIEPGPEKTLHGIKDGIRYSYPGGFAARPRRWMLRRFDDASSRIAILFKLFMAKSHGKLDVVILYSRDAKAVLFWTRFLHLLKIPVVLELCEWPLAIAESHGNHNWERAKRFCHDAVNQADAVLPISSYIAKEVQENDRRNNKHTPSFQVPILIDSDPDKDVTPETSSTTPYLMYMGSIYYFDIAILVVDIISELVKSGTFIQVKFTGGGNSSRFDQLKSYAKQMNVLEYLDFTGFISDAELESMMNNAAALLAPLPENPQSVSRFPTKIGYYLASGKPVVTNAVGDVSLYLQDNVSAFVVDECNAKKFAETITTLLQAPERAAQIGLKGREVAYNKFYYPEACMGILKFLKDVADRGNIRKP